MTSGKVSTVRPGPTSWLCPPELPVALMTGWLGSPVLRVPYTNTRCFRVILLRPNILTADCRQWRFKTILCLNETGLLKEAAYLAPPHHLMELYWSNMNIYSQECWSDETKPSILMMENSIFPHPKNGNTHVIEESLLLHKYEIITLTVCFSGKLQHELQNFLPTCVHFHPGFFVNFSI